MQPRELLTVTSGYDPSCIWLRDVRVLVFIKWVWVDLDTSSGVQLVFSLLSLVLFSLLYDIFLGLGFGRRFVCTVSRVLSGHCSVRSHLGKFRIVEDLMYVVQVIMRQWTTWFGTVKNFRWKPIVSLMRLPRWTWVLGYQFVICVLWRSGVP
jgi:hypothetical protein